MQPYVLAFLLGFVASWALNRWKVMWRVCCREHYEKHKTCRCRDCAWDRKMGEPNL